LVAEELDRPGEMFEDGGEVRRRGPRPPASGNADASTDGVLDAEPMRLSD
jgi:hypothetical protein